MKEQRSFSFVNVILGVLAFVMIATSFDRNPISALLQPVVLSVGSYTIRRDEFQILMRHEYAQRELTSSNISGVAFLENIANNTLWDMETKSLGIRISHEQARRVLLAHPYFFQNGKFDAQKFNQWMGRYNLSLEQCIQYEKRRLEREYLQNALAALTPLPALVKNLATKGFFQKRSGFYKAFLPQTNKKPPAPSEKQLQAIYAENARLFQVPERRHVAVLTLEPAQFQEATFQQIEDALDSGQTLTQIEQKHHLKLQILNIDAQGKGSALPWSSQRTQSILKHIFSLPSGHAVQMIRLSDKHYLWIKIERIEPKRQLSYAEVEQQVRAIYNDQFYQSICIKQAKEFALHPVWKEMQKIAPVDQLERESSIPESVQTELFRLRPGKHNVITESGRVYLVCLEHIIDAQPSDPALKDRLSEMLSQQWPALFRQDYSAALLAQHPVHFNEKELQKLFSSTTQ